jgi:hypothetical protein
MSNRDKNAIKYLRNPKKKPGNSPLIPTNNLETKGGVAQKAIMITDLRRKSELIFCFIVKTILKS